MHARNLTGSWTSTVNQLRDMAFKIKDAVFLIDDFKPGLLRGRKADEMYDKADDMIREQANGAARGRCNDRGESRADKRPRGLIFASGEEPPRNESLRARTVFCKLSEDSLPDAKLRECQADAKEGTYATAMAGYLQWLAQEGRIAKIQGDGHATLLEEIDKQRDIAISARKFQEEPDDDRYLRTCENVGSLQVGFRHFLDFAFACGAIDDAGRERLDDLCWETLVGPAFDIQIWYQRQQEPTARFVHLLKAATQGNLAHIGGMDGAPPGGTGVDADADLNLTCGWFKQGMGWISRGPCFARVGPAGVLVTAEAGWKVANDMVGTGGDGLGVSSASAMGRRLAQKGLLLNAGETQGLNAKRKRFDGEPPKTHWLFAHRSFEIVWDQGEPIPETSAHARTVPPTQKIIDFSRISGGK
jgi:hypothetical protein